jgi:hypothetical protein
LAATQRKLNFMAYRDEDDFLEEEWAPAGDDHDADDWDGDGAEEDEELIDCPECGQQVHIESQQCPHCGYYILDESDRASVWQGRSWWWIVLGVLGTIAVIVALSRPW